MTAKEYLSQVMEIDTRIKASLENIAYLKALATKVSSTLSGMPGSPNRTGSKVEDVMLKIALMEGKVNEDIEKMMRLKQEISETIDYLDKPKERLVLSLRYVYLLDWKEISKSMKCSPRYPFVIHNRALSKIKVPKN